MNVGFLTQHGKERLLNKLFSSELDANLFRVDGFDTDTLGTFTRECPRKGTQVEAAARKAQLALELSDADWGLGSEGAFHLDPYLSLLPWNTEILVLIERSSGRRIIGLAHGKAMSWGAEIRSREELQAAAQRTGFPDQHLVLRRDGADGPACYKGISQPDQLHQAFDSEQSLRPGSTLYIEADLRAHANPTRQAVILDAGRDLVRRVRSRCPVCTAPGFGLQRMELGAPCAACGTPTRVARAEVWNCPSCGHHVVKPPAEPLEADPQRCDLCNP